MGEIENEKVIDAEPAPALPLALVDVDHRLTEEDIKKAEQMVESIKRITLISLKVTNHADWSLQSGRPYLENSGCMKVANVWGINFKDRKFVPEGGERHQDDRGQYILFTVQGKAEFRGRTIDDIGTCSTRDDFFGKKGGTLKPLEDVDLENIKKKAVTNLQGRLLKKILGLNPTMEELRTAGIDLGKSTVINRAAGGDGGGRISQPQANRLFAILMTGVAEGEAGNEDRKKRQDALRAYMKNEFKIEHSKDILTKDYEKICDQAKAIAETATAESV